MPPRFSQESEGVSMGLRDLTTALMVAQSATLVDRTHPDRAALVGIVEVAGLVPRIDRAHDGLLHIQRGSSDATESPRLAEIRTESRTTDLRHDALVRGLWNLLTALASLASDAKESDALLALRDHLIPEGVSITQRSYLEESGFATLTAARLTSDHRAALAKIPTPWGSALDCVEEWFARAARLGELEHERAEIESPAVVTAADVLVARNEWVRVMNALRTNLALVEELPPAVTRLLDRLAAAEKRATAEPVANDNDAEPAAPAEKPTGTDG